MAMAALPALANLAGGVSSKGGDILVIRRHYPAKVSSKTGRTLEPAMDRELHVDPKAVAWGGAAVLIGALALAVGAMTYEGVHVKGLGGEWTVVPGVKDYGWTRNLQARLTRKLPKTYATKILFVCHDPPTKEDYDRAKREHGIIVRDTVNGGWVCIAEV